MTFQDHTLQLSILPVTMYLFWKHFFYTKCSHLRRDTNIVQSTCVLNDVPSFSVVQRFEFLASPAVPFARFCSDPYFNRVA